MKHTGFILWLVLLLGCQVVYAADEPLDRTKYHVLEGLGTGICSGSYTTNPPVNTNDSSGEVGVSSLRLADKQLKMAGTIQPLFDPGLLDSSGNYLCERKQQVYSLTSRTGRAIPGFSNTVIGLKIPSVCAATGGTCQWSTQYAGPALTSGSAPDPSSEPLTIFPESAVESMDYVSQSSGDPIRTQFSIDLEGAARGEDDQITIVQYVYKPDDTPYFDVVWEISTFRGTYNQVDFNFVVDTYTAGNDFGYGYICDVTHLIGGTGGTSFFQGFIGLQKPATLWEDWWAMLFYRFKKDDFPAVDLTNPLNLTVPAPLEELVDNAVALQWTDLTIGQEPIYIPMRWTFNDPIRESTYGTTRSLFVVSSDDDSFTTTSGGGTLKDNEPMIFDIMFDPRDWRGKVHAARLPITCEKTEECPHSDQGDSCQYHPDCSPSDTDCTKYCFINACSSVDSSCSGSDVCVLGMCISRSSSTSADDGTEDWYTEDEPELVSSGSRTVFTVIPDSPAASNGGKTAINAAAAASLKDQLGVDTEEEAQLLLEWFLGEKNNTDNTGGSPSRKVVMDTNEDYSVNLVATDMMRSRYDADDNQEWLLGDTTHAEPVYVGGAPANGWKDSAGPEKYSEYTNSDDFQQRHPVLLVSANDGMLHCFDATNGQELWAFVPWDVLPKVKELARPFYTQLRQPMMNLTPVVHDVWNDGASEWTTVLLVGSRGGGNTYYAFEIQAPSGHLNPEYMWWYSDDDLGLTYSVPTTGRVRLGAGDPPPESWLVFFGSGYASSSAVQAGKVGYFYAVDLFNGVGGDYKADLVEKLAITSADISGIDANPTPTNNVLSNPIVGDQDYDGYEDVVYVGDLAGHLLRFSIGSAAGMATVSGEVLFATYRMGGKTLGDFTQKVENDRVGTTDQDYEFLKYPRSITVMPEIWRTDETPTDDILGSSSNNNRLMVFFGTGKYDSFYDSFDKHLEDPSDTTSAVYHQQVFGIVDRDDGVMVTEGDLRSNSVSDSLGTTGNLWRTISTSDSTKIAKGWHIELDSNAGLEGERVITDGVVMQQNCRAGDPTGCSTKEEWIYFFTTFTPNMKGTCDLRNVDKEGGGFFMTVRAETGTNPSFVVQDVNHDRDLSNDATAVFTGYAGQQITGAVLSKVVVTQMGAMVKAASDVSPILIEVAGTPTISGAQTSFYRVK